MTLNRAFALVSWSLVIGGIGWVVVQSYLMSHEDRQFWIKFSQSNLDADQNDLDALQRQSELLKAHAVRRSQRYGATAFPAISVVLLGILGIALNRMQRNRCRQIQDPLGITLGKASSRKKI